MESSMSPNSKYSLHMFGAWPTTTNHLVTTTAVALLFGDALRRRRLLRSYLKSISLLGDVPRLKDVCHERALQFTAMSYLFCKAPAVGASGAIFGLVGSFGMFVLRHRGMVKGTDNDLKHIAQVIALNMTIGFLSQGIDNWGHAGGLLGGAAVSWLLGPAWALQSVARDGRRIFEDKATIFSLIRRHPK